MENVPANLRYYNQKCDSIMVERKNNENINEETYIESDHDKCVLLNYWVYSKLDGIFSFNNLSIILRAFAPLQQIWNDIVEILSRNSRYKICRPDNVTIMQKDWTKRKELYDYYVDYDFLLPMAQIHKSNECTYYNKLNDMFSLYKTFEKVCEPKRDNCPDVFYKCQEKNIESAIKKLTCDATLKSTSLRTLMDNPSLQVTIHTEKNQEREEHFDLDIKDNITVEYDTELDRENSGIGTKVTHTILGGAPVYLTGTILYRVPGFVGSLEKQQIVRIQWIRFHLIHKKQAIRLSKIQQAIYLINLYKFNY
ncbi:CYIR protein [Plasmodium cynomolgi strain B]|uniref:CYIR protein n=1 Tax=Plasmodium cynomolgi (strain B) TaxID=1120755 RepID=K6UNV6_PLACD|nr:CYIR protein [Plasmodium cynomolgi strain B]GAB69843.1 CYIR protein [Plasmodium cynomolgi strain B]